MYRCCTLLWTECWLLLFGELTVKVLYDVTWRSPAHSVCIRAFKGVHQETLMWIIQQQSERTQISSSNRVMLLAEVLNADRRTNVLRFALHFATNPEKHIHHEFAVSLKKLTNLINRTNTHCNKRTSAGKQHNIVIEQ